MSLASKEINRLRSTLRHIPSQLNWSCIHFHVKMVIHYIRCKTVHTFLPRQNWSSIPSHAHFVMHSFSFKTSHSFLIIQKSFKTCHVFLIPSRANTSANVMHSFSDQTVIHFFSCKTGQGILVIQKWSGIPSHANWLGIHCNAKLAKRSF